MEELFDLLEDGEDQEPEVMDIPERGKLSLPGTAGERKDPALLQGGRQGSDLFWAEQSGEETFLAQNAETVRGRERPGDVSARLLETVEESIGTGREISVVPNVKAGVWEVRSGEMPGGVEKTPAPLREWAAELREGAAEERWLETVKARPPGAERLYLGINGPRLRGVEQGQRTIVVRLNEPEQRTFGAAAMDARALDRVFQRDARRYDGGLNPL